MQARQMKGDSLDYFVVEPDDYDPQNEYPAVVLLHGYGASMSDLVGLSPVLDRTGYLYFFPQRPHHDPDRTRHDWLRMDPVRRVGRPSYS